MVPMVAGVDVSNLEVAVASSACGAECRASAARPPQEPRVARQEDREYAPRPHDATPVCQRRDWIGEVVKEAHGDQTVDRLTGDARKILSVTHDELHWCTHLPCKIAGVLTRSRRVTDIQHHVPIEGVPDK